MHEVSNELLADDYYLSWDSSLILQDSICKKIGMGMHHVGDIQHLFIADKGHQNFMRGGNKAGCLKGEWEM